MKTGNARFLSLIMLAAIALAACAPGGATPQAESSPIPVATLAPIETVNSAAQDGQIELTGMIESMSPVAWTLNGQVLAILPTTELKGDFLVGDLVKAHASVQADGSLAARQIEPVPGAAGEPASVAGAEYDFTGAVDAMATDQWTVAGTTFGVTSQTEIKGSFAIGDLVKVHLLLGADGSLVAREIEAPEAELEGAVEGTRAEFVGLVDSISPDAWVVGGQTLGITSETEIKGTFAVGDAVKVHVLVGSDGALIAREIEAAEVDQVGIGDDNSNTNSNANENENGNTNDNTGNTNDNTGNTNGNTNDNGGGGGGGGGGGNDNGGG